MNTILRWLILALAIAVTAYILPGVSVDNVAAALVAAVVLALINAFIRPILLLLTLPLSIITLGLFAVILNTLLILLASAMVPGFEVANFWWALLFSIILAMVNALFKDIADGKKDNL